MWHVNKILLTYLLTYYYCSNFYPFKRPLKIDKTKVLKTNDEVQNYCRMLFICFLQYLWPELTIIGLENQFSVFFLSNR